MSDPLQLAADLLATGRTEEAVSAITTAADRGDVSALMQLAVWRLAGAPLPRDLPLARELLRRAVAIGHVDAALMEVALTANGSGATPDWASAVALLERAAASDPIADQQLQLLRAMRLRADGSPAALPQPETLATAPTVRRFPAFCTQEECAHIATIAAELLEPATVFDPGSNRMIAHPIRNSDNAAIGPTRETLVVQAINQRIAAATGTLAAQGEPLTVLRYGPGQQYRAHVDTLADPSNQRLLTAILYLNAGYRGGETVFPLLDVSFRAQPGDLLVFENVDTTGNPEPRSRHAGLPVSVGNKWIATRWIRARPVDPWQLSNEVRAASAPA